jgi:hypothetical protein
MIRHLKIVWLILFIAMCFTWYKYGYAFNPDVVCHVQGEDVVCPPGYGTLTYFLHAVFFHPFVALCVLGILLWIVTMIYLKQITIATGLPLWVRIILIASLPVAILTDYMLASNTWHTFGFPTGSGYPTGDQQDLAWIRMLSIMGLVAIAFSLVMVFTLPGRRAYFTQKLAVPQTEDV